MSFVKGLVTGLLLTAIIETVILSVPYLKYNYWDHPKLIFGLHFHHSLIGLIIVFLTPLILRSNKTVTLFFIGLGVGIIAIHTISDGRLIFIG